MANAGAVVWRERRLRSEWPGSCSLRRHGRRATRSIRHRAECRASTELAARNTKRHYPRMETLPEEMLASRAVLRAHCYRMLGHPQDAEDAVQDTFVRAVRAIEGFEGRSSATTWLIKIATRVCLDALASRKRRRMPTEVPPGEPNGPFRPTPHDEWIGPYPEVWLERSEHLDERLALRQRVDLALITVLKKLPPKQRAALLLTEVFDWSAAEVADTLDLSVPSINSALQRAREKLGRGIPGRLEVDPTVVERYRDAFSRYDVDALVQLLTDDVVFDMPPFPLWLRGPDHVRQFLLGHGAGCRGSLTRPVQASGMSGFAQYRNGGETPWALVLLETRGGRVAGVHSFLDTAGLFPLFELPLRISAQTPMSSESGLGPIP